MHPLSLVPGALCLSLAASPTVEPTRATPEAHPPAPAHATQSAPTGRKTIVAARGLTGVVWHEEGPRQVVGGGVFVERLLIQHALEVELAVNALSIHEAVEVPIELLAKVPVHLGPVVEISPGVGGLVAWTPGGPGGITPGVIANTDVFFWFGDDFGLLVEVDGVALSTPIGWVPQVEVGSGVARRF